LLVLLARIRMVPPLDALVVLVRLDVVRERSLT